MSLLIADDAEALIAAAGMAGDDSATGHRAAVEVLGREINSGRRFGMGLVALILVGVGGMLLGVGADAMKDDDGALTALGFVLGLALVVPGAVLGLAVTRAGGRVIAAHGAWTRADPFGSTEPGSIVRRLLSVRSLLRSALTAVALIAAVFAWSIFGLGLAPSDPLDAGDSQVSLTVMGLVWGIALTFAFWHLLMGEIRAGRAHAAAVIRGR